CLVKMSADRPMAWVVLTRNWKKASACGLISGYSRGLICIAPFRMMQTIVDFAMRGLRQVLTMGY
ncbi:hypothetical protein N9X05_14755, partial [Paracoccaceae bacterium]|nr:hypothetical protein [Paracoccaceae bacterium]